MRMTDGPSQRLPADEVKELRELALNRRAASFNSFRQRLQKAQAASKLKKEAATPVAKTPKSLFPLAAE
jgi:hypothetical protein